MSSKLPQLRSQKIIDVLEKVGFKNTRRSKGSHFRYATPTEEKPRFPFIKEKLLARDY